MPESSPRRTRKTALAIAIASITIVALAGTGAAIVGSMTSSGSSRTGLASMGAAAGGHLDGAIRWLERRAAEGSDELDRLIREHSPERLLAQASERLAERLGLFEYQPGDSGERWPRFDPQSTPADRSVVLLIHGLDEPGDIWDELAPALHLDGYRVLRFNYANDQSPVRSADQFALALSREAAEAGIEELAIVAHSMGGLISRDVLTRHAADEEWGGPKIRHLVTLGTPNQGSPVAALQPIGEAREVVARLWSSRTLEPAEVLSFLVDGSGDAALALAPGSSYLKDLNARPLPEGTPITVIAAHATAAQRDRLDEIASSAPLDGLLSEELRGLLLERIDSITDLVGDGVVPLESTPLEGASEYMVVTANHRSMLRTVPLVSTDAVPPAIPLILEALRPAPENAQDTASDPNSP